MSRLTEHGEVAAALRAATLAPSDFSDDDARRAAIEGSGPDDAGRLAIVIEESSFRVTDADVAAVRDTTGSDKGAFEIVMSASIGAGLRRWDAARHAIEEATRETR